MFRKRCINYQKKFDWSVHFVVEFLYAYLEKKLNSLIRYCNAFLVKQFIICEFFSGRFLIKCDLAFYCSLRRFGFDRIRAATIVVGVP